jgi:L-fucono-1,5-lactonase
MKHHERRAFLKASVLGLAGAMKPWPLPAAAAATASTGIVDTHTHFYDPTRPQGVPWPPQSDKLLYRRVLPEHLAAVTKGLGVTGTVVVEASPRVEDNQWLLDLAARQPLILGVVGKLQPGTDDFRRHLTRFAKNARFRGIRVGADDVSKGLSSPRVLDDLKRLAGEDLELDVIGGPAMLSDVARLADKLPDMRIVINHVAGIPIDGKAVKPDLRAGLRAAAGHRNVYCKVSGLVEATGRDDGKAPADVRFYRRLLDVLWELFGEDRLIYGSNWPVSERFAPYPVVLGVVREYFSAKGQAESDKFFRKNALAAYKWPQR